MILDRVNKKKITKFKKIYLFCVFCKYYILIYELNWIFVLFYPPQFKEKKKKSIFFSLICCSLFITKISKKKNTNL